MNTDCGVEVACACGASARVPGDRAGKRVRCRRCGEACRVPDDATGRRPPERPAPTRGRGRPGADPAGRTRLALCLVPALLGLMLISQGIDRGAGDAFGGLTQREVQGQGLLMVRLGKGLVSLSGLLVLLTLKPWRALGSRTDPARP